MISVAGFRESFPQFAEALFPDGRVAFHLSLAGKAMSEEKWEDLYEEGICLYAAHHLTLEAAAMKAADGTGGMDAAAGPVTSQTKTVGSVSKSETRGGAAASGSANVNAGHWNDTVYGKQWWQLAMMVGAGAAHV